MGRERSPGHHPPITPGRVNLAAPAPRGARHPGRPAARPDQDPRRHLRPGASWSLCPGHRAQGATHCPGREAWLAGEPLVLAVVPPSGFVTTGLPGQWATMTGAQVAWPCCDGTGGEPAQFWSRPTSRLTARSWRGTLPGRPRRSTLPSRGVAAAGTGMQGLRWPALADPCVREKGPGSGQPTLMAGSRSDASSAPVPLEPGVTQKRWEPMAGVSAGHTDYDAHRGRSSNRRSKFELN